VRLDPADPSSRLEVRHGEGHPRDQATTADGHDYGGDIRYVIEELEAHRALTGDEARIVEGMEEGEASLFGQLQSQIEDLQDRTL
jgi:hypothetical protein